MMNNHALFVLRIMICSGCNSKPTKDTNSPSLKLIPEVVELGDIEAGKESSRTGQFKLVNQGTADLIILGSKTSCGCTVPKQIPVRIRPESEETVSFEVKARNETGLHSSFITLLTNDPARPNIKVEIRWVEKTAIYFGLKSLDFYLDDLTSPTTKQVPVFVSQNIDLEQVELKSNYQGLKLSKSIVKESSENPTTERSLIIETVLFPAEKDLNGTAEIRVFTKDGNYFANLPVTWKVDPPYHFNPTSFFHSNISKMHSVECQLFLHARNTSGIVIDRITLDGHALDHKITNMTNDSSSKILVFAVKAGGNPGIEEHLVKLKLANNPVEIEIPVIIYVK